MSPQEQAFLIAGNLSAVFHDGGQHDAVWINSENVLLVGEQPVMSLDGVAEAGTVETRLRDILSSSKAVNERASALLYKEKADITSEPKTESSAKDVNTAKVKAEQKQDSAAETKPMTMRQKLEAYKAQQK